MKNIEFISPIGIHNTQLTIPDMIENGIPLIRISISSWYSPYPINNKYIDIVGTQKAASIEHMRMDADVGFFRASLRNKSSEETAVTEKIPCNII